MAVNANNVGIKITDADGNSGKIQGFTSNDRAIIEAIVALVNSYRPYVEEVKNKKDDWALLSQANTFQQPVTLPAQSGELSAIPENQAVTAGVVNEALAELEQQITVSVEGGVTIEMADSEPVDVQPNRIYFYETTTGLLDGITVDDPVELV